MASDFLRFRRGTLQTPIHHYIQPDTGRRITVIGAVHMGEPGYYAGLRTVIDDLEAGGAVVQCEASALLPYDEESLTDDERTVLALRDRKTELERRRVAELGWVRQLDALGYPDRWQRVDLDMAEIIRRVGPEVMLRTGARGIKLFDRPDNDPRGIEQFRLSLHVAFTGFRFAVWSNARRAAGTGRPSTGSDVVLLDQRDAVALGGVWSTQQDVVLLWGCAHLPRLEAGISSRGFVRTGATEWRTAAILPSIRSILSRIRALPRTTAGTDASDAREVTDAAGAVRSTAPSESTPKP